MMRVNFWMVPRNGLEPLRPLRVTGFSCHYNFRCFSKLRICGLDFLFTLLLNAM